MWTKKVIATLLVFLLSFHQFLEAALFIDVAPLDKLSIVRLVAFDTEAQELKNITYFKFDEADQFLGANVPTAPPFLISREGDIIFPEGFFERNNSQKKYFFRTSGHLVYQGLYEGGQYVLSYLFTNQLTQVTRDVLNTFRSEEQQNKFKV